MVFNSYMDGVVRGLLGCWPIVNGGRVRKKQLLFTDDTALAAE